MTSISKTIKDLRKTTLKWYHCFSYIQEHGLPIRPMQMETTTCKHCGTTFEGNYCPRCGQSRKVSQITKRGFVSAFMEAYPQLAKAFCRTILELIYRPGYMIRDYFRGHRIIYSGPFKTFLVIISIYVLFNTFLNTDSQNETVMFSSNLQEELIKDAADSTSTDKDAQTFLNKIQKADKLEKKLSQDEKIAPIWNSIKNKAQEKGSMYIFFTVPLLALASKLTFKRQRFDGRKLIYAEHFMTFTYLYATNISFCLLGYLLWGKPDYPGLLIVFYLAWTYKGLYGWNWRETGKYMLPFLSWAALLFGIALILIITFLILIFILL